MKQACNTLTSAQRKLLARPELAPVVNAFASAAFNSRQWDRLVKEGIAKHGERPQGGHVSGIYSEHFPQDLKDTLRLYAHAVTAHNKHAYEVRPSRVRLSTIRAVRDAVHARDGSGFYG